MAIITVSSETEDFIPKGDLEKAYIQARYLKSMHLWKKGTTELLAGKVGQATGFYLAMTRTQCLDGQESHAEATLDCIWDYHKRFSNADKLSVIRIICNILKEKYHEGNENLIAKERVRTRFLRMAVALAGQLHEDKVAIVEALALIKKSTDEDLIGSTVLKKQIADLEKFVDQCKQKLMEVTGSTESVRSETLSPDSENVLSTIFHKISQLPIDINVFLLLTKLATNLIAGDRLAEAVHVCSYIRSYCVELPKRKQSLTCGESISKVFENALSDADGTNSFILDATLQELKLQNYQSATARKTVATSTFEEHFLSWSKEVGTSKLEFLATQDVSEQKSFDLSLDLVIAHTLNYLADQLIHKNKFEEACACSQLAVLARIQAKKIDQREAEDLTVIATVGLISKQYERALELLSDVRNTLQFSNYNAIWFERLSTYTNMLDHLFGQLVIPGCKLNIRSFSTLNYVLTLYSRIAQTPQFNELLPRVLELLSTKVDDATAANALRIYWKGLIRLPLRTIFENYVEPLAALTETSIDATLANACYLDFLDNLNHQELETQYVIPLFTRIINDREIDGEKNAVTIIPLHAALTMLHMESGNSDKCQISCERLQAVKFEVITLPPDALIKIQCTQAFFQIEKVLLTMEKREPHSFTCVQSAEVASMIKELIQDDLTKAGSQKELSFVLCDFLGALIRDDIRTPSELLDTVKNFDSEILAETFEKLEKKYGHVVLVELLEELIQAKSAGQRAGKDSSIIPLLLIKAKHRQKMGRLKESDKIYLQIIELEKLMIDDPNAVTSHSSLLTEAAPEAGTYEERESDLRDRVFQTQIDFLRNLTRRAEFDLAFELAFELITQSTKKFKTEQATDLFETIDSFALHHRYSNSIDLLLAVVSKAYSLSFDQKMTATYDLAFLSCLQQNEFEKAQLLLNRTKNIAKMYKSCGTDQNFIQSAASRFTCAPADKEAFRFTKLSTALDTLRKKKIYCRDIELFTTMVFELLDQNYVTYPDEGTKHSPPD
ncbi:hypothetical protein BH10CYA1_BH10CYA1_07480 [soil metagenome]